MARRKPRSIPDALLDQLFYGAGPRTAFNPDGILNALKKALAERMLNAEMDQHLDNEAADGRVNTCNGCGQKTVLTGTGRLALDIPRDRQGTFDPQLIAKYQRCFPGFDDKIVSMYARGMSVREIQGHIRELYGVHLLRTSMDFVAFKDRRAVATALKHIYRATDDLAAAAALDAFEAGFWGRKYPAIVQSWRRAWPEVIPFYAFPADVRRILYTTNSIEALNAKLRRAVRARGHFSTSRVAIKPLFLVLHRTEKQWIMPPRECTMAKAQFAILFGERFAKAPA